MTYDLSYSCKLASYTLTLFNFVKKSLFNLFYITNC